MTSPRRDPENARIGTDEKRISGTGATIAPSTALAAAWAGLIALPLAGFFLLLAAPSLDVEWENHPAHFWLVLAAALISAGLAYSTGHAARRRRDARLFLVSLSLLTSAAFLGLHALATPAVLLSEPNAGFALAVPVGLFLASVLAAGSAVDLSAGRAEAVMRHAGMLRLVLAVVLVAWGAVSLAGVPPLDDPTPAESASGPLVALAVVGLALYAYAALQYLRLALERPSPLTIGVLTAFVLLAEAMVAVAFARNWLATWWEWHLLMLAAFAVVAYGAQRAGHGERFSALYLEDTVAGKREVSVVFADLAGFTTFSETRDPREVSAMLNAYFEAAIPPVVRGHGGDIDRLVGDAIMATFNTRGDQPDHAERAARAAMGIRDATEAVAREHPGWPRFRVGVNSGEAMVGVLGAKGGRSYTVIGDTVNLAARLEAAAPVGAVVVGGATRRRLGDAAVEPLDPVEVKGKAEPVEAFLLLGAPT